MRLCYNCVFIKFIYLFGCHFKPSNACSQSRIFFLPICPPLVSVPAPKRNWVVELHNQKFWSYAAETSWCFISHVCAQNQMWLLNKFFFCLIGKTNGESVAYDCWRFSTDCGGNVYQLCYWLKPLYTSFIMLPDATDNDEHICSLALCCVHKFRVVLVRWFKWKLSSYE